jgi:spore coat protein CotH
MRVRPVRVGAWTGVFVALMLTAASASAQTIEEFYDDSVVHDLYLTLNSKDWAALKQNFTENIFYPTALTWRGVTVRNVGIRSRGLGSRSGTKPGLKVDCDYYAVDQTCIGGQKSFVLDNLVQDPSMLRERLSMSIFRRMGVPAPREAHARLFVNNAFVGVYAMVEAIDKGFLGRTFGADAKGGVENDGYLYEYDYTRDYRFQYLGSNVTEYKMFDPKTHEKDAADKKWGTIEDMIQAINETPDSIFEREVSPYLDLNLVARQLAIENFLAEDDGILGYAGLNNFYMYRFEDSKRLQFLPWDKDNTFHSIDFDVMSRVGENVLSRRLLAMSAYVNAYLDTLLATAVSTMEPDPEVPEFDKNGKPVSRPGWLEREVQRQYEQIRTFARQDTFKPHSNGDFEASIQFLLDFARGRSPFVEAAVTERRKQ